MALEIDVSIFKDAPLYAYNLLLATDGFLKFLVFPSTKLVLVSSDNPCFRS